MKLKCSYLASAAVLTLLAAGAGCKSSDADSRPMLVVSIEPQKYMLQQIVGDDFNVVTLMPNGENPEIFEPSMSGRIAVDKAPAYFTTGYFPFEANLTLSSSDPSTIINTSEGIEPIYGTHSHSDEHHTFLHADSTHQTPDPHIWTSVRNARSMSRIMYETVCRLNPDEAERYTENYKRFDTRLDSLDHAFVARLDSLPNKSFLVWHPSLSYFARDYGLNQIAVGFEGKESSMSTLRGVINEARADSVEVFFYQRDVDSRQADAVNSGVGSRMVPINPSQYEWEEGMALIVDELTSRK